MKTFNRLIEVNQINKNIILDIRYATQNNFVGTPVYENPYCYVHENLAQKLDKVQKSLEGKGLGLKIFDAYRPLAAQEIFWKLMPDERYVANPVKGSNHNRGVAVDVTLVDLSGKELIMPTDFDDFTNKAHRDYNDFSREILLNRSILEEAMRKHGFIGLPTEWWHFDDVEWQKYEILDIAFEALDKI